MKSYILVFVLICVNNNNICFRNTQLLFSITSKKLNSRRIARIWISLRIIVNKEEFGLEFDFSIFLWFYFKDLSHIWKIKQTVYVFLKVNWILVCSLYLFHITNHFSSNFSHLLIIAWIFTTYSLFYSIEFIL